MRAALGLSRQALQLQKKQGMGPRLQQAVAALTSIQPKQQALQQAQMQQISPAAKQSLPGKGPCPRSLGRPLLLAAQMMCLMQAAIEMQQGTALKGSRPHLTGAQ